MILNPDSARGTVTPDFCQPDKSTRRRLLQVLKEHQRLVPAENTSLVYSFPPIPIERTPIMKHEHGRQALTLLKVPVPSPRKGCKAQHHQIVDLPYSK